MFIKKILVENYKCFQGRFELELKNGTNILVGDNEAGKSTILQAIHLALSGLLNGRYLRNELSQYLFNYNVEKEYIDSLSTEEVQPPPHILIEIFFEGDDLPLFEGDANSERKKGCGLSFKIEFDTDYTEEYNELIKGDVKTIPIEYYKVSWKTFARESITSRSIPIKSVLIDSTFTRRPNGSDLYISRIIRNDLEEKEKVGISQAHRKLKETFMADDTIKAINKKISDKANITDKKVKISVDLSSQNAWETSLMTYLDEIPFHHIGKGEQCIIKTNLALAHKKAKEANLILLEEPENHLSHSKLNQFINAIKTQCEDKQILISTHSSFVANKLGLENLILLHNQKEARLNDLKPDTQEFFKKLPGYQTLRLLLCEKAILVEGDCDELVVQRAYIDSNDGKLPIEDCIDIISVGLTFKRFLEIADKIEKPVAVLTDNDGSVENLKKKYEDYLGEKKKENIEIFYDDIEDTGDLKIGDDKFNYNTLEPKIVKANNLNKMNGIFSKSFSNIDDLHKYMKNNKTDCALTIFDSKEKIKYPEYIKKAIEWCNGKK